MKKRIISFILMGVLWGSWTGATFVNDEEINQEAEKRRQKVEIMSFFMKDPKDAKMPTAPIAVNLFNQSVRYYKNNDLVLAKQTVKEAIDQDPTLAVAYELLGDIENLQQDLSAAKSNYEIAYNLKPSKRIQEKMSKLKEEVKVDKALKSYDEQHFIIKYNEEEQSYEGYELRDLLRKTYRQISNSLAFYFKHKVAVILYDEADFRKITGTPHWVAGLYDGKVRLPINKKGFSELDLEALTTHEVTHAFIAFISNRNAPAWLNEGFAEYQENMVKKVDTSSFNSALSSGQLFPLVQLMSHAGPLQLKDTNRINLFYQQSYALVSYLVSRYGMFKVKELMQEYAKGKDSDQVVRAVLKISIVRLEKEWLEIYSNS